MLKSKHMWLKVRLSRDNCICVTMLERLRDNYPTRLKNASSASPAGFWKTPSRARVNSWTSPLTERRGKFYPISCAARLVFSLLFSLSLIEMFKEMCLDKIDTQKKSFFKIKEKYDSTFIYINNTVLFLKSK